MKKKIAFSWMVCALCMGSAVASAGSFLTTARVISSTPVYRTVRIREPYQRCRDETVVVKERERHGSTAGRVLGGVIGGVLGHQIGKGRGRTVATVGGAVLGGLVGDRASRSRPRKTRRTREVCETVHAYREERRLKGYDVSYRFHGHLFNIRLADDPGRTLPVRVSVRPG